MFRIFGLKCLFRPPKWGLWGLWTSECDYSSSWPPKGTSLHKSTSFKLSTVKIGWRVWPVGELTESVTDKHTDRHTHTGKFIFCPCIALDRQLLHQKTYLTEGVKNDASARLPNVTGLWPPEHPIRWPFLALAPRITCVVLHQNRLIRLQNIVFTRLVTNGQTNKRTRREHHAFCQSR